VIILRDVCIEDMYAHFRSGIGRYGLAVQLDVPPSLKPPPYPLHQACAGRSDVGLEKKEGMRT
jgi:hypothetical protein